MILAAAKQLVERGVSPLWLEVTAVDRDELATDLCFINMTLWRVPCRVVTGDLFGKPIRQRRTLYWGAWQLLDSDLEK